MRELVRRLAGLRDPRYVDRPLLEDDDAVVERDRVGAEGERVEIAVARHVIPGVQAVDQRLAELDERAGTPQSALPSPDVGGVHVLAAEDAERRQVSEELDEHA